MQGMECSSDGIRITVATGHEAAAHTANQGCSKVVCHGGMSPRVFVGDLARTVNWHLLIGVGPGLLPLGKW